MRKQIYLALAQYVRLHVPAIKHIDLWNEQISENSAVWPMPALFVEFEPYQVRQMASHCFSADIPVRLHVITRAVAIQGGAADKRASAALDYFNVLDSLQTALASLSGKNFSTFMLTQQITCHDHAELLESIECYVTHAVQGSVPQTARPATPLKLKFD